ncbi:MAG: heme-binding domain-containing protein [Draconibacterium sp.]|nr:heme-binding domain-containing protein [Draconibacterium sp.]
MRKLFRIIFFVLLLAFVVIQFFQPEKNRGEVSANHILKKEKVPENIKTILQNACLDCHSNQTNYLWYHKIAPVSWMVNKHIVDGKDELNFSEWGKLDIYDKIGTLEKICRDVKRKKMPIKAYTTMHKKAKLSDEQVDSLCGWTEKLSLELMSAVEN